MKIILSIIVICLCSCESVFADEPDPWTTKDTAGQAIVTTALLFDYGQTLQIAKNPKYQERNPILGKHPSEGQITPYFLSVAVFHGIISWALPKDYRPYWQSLWVGIELGSIGNNYAIGIRSPF